MEHPESEKPDAVSRIEPSDAVPDDADEAGEQGFAPPPTEGPGLESEEDVGESEQGYGA